MDQDTPLIARPQRADWPWLAALVVVTAALTLPVARRMVDGLVYSDYIEQLALAESMARTQTIQSANFLYQLITSLLRVVLLGRSFAGAGKFAAMALAALQGVITYLVVRPISGPARAWWGAPVAAALAFMLGVIAPINLPTWPWHNLYEGYIGLAVYHNPVVNTLRPLALLLSLVVVRVCAAPAGPRRAGRLAAVGALAALAALAQPTYTLCVLPALALLAIFRLWRRQPLNWPLALAVVVPSAVVLAWQYWFTVSRQGEVVVFAPLSVMLHFTAPASLLPKLLLSIAFPLAVYIAYGRGARREVYLNTSWLIFFISLGLTYLFAEGGRHPFDGHLLVGSQVASFILFVASARVWWARWRAAPALDRWAGWHVVLAGILALHLACGLLWYYVQVTRGQGAWF